jgi:putative ATPase
MQNVHYDSAEVTDKGQHYLYPHAFENHWVKQQYLPDDLVDRKYYVPGDNRTEQAAKAYWEKIKNE